MNSTRYVRRTRRGGTYTFRELPIRRSQRRTPVDPPRWQGLLGVLLWMAFLCLAAMIAEAA